ncbi:zinc finger protein 445-like [Xyrauchen texanus]|uniref:zinc finger protein 445-like n=1 Tax=Xyrauchen texanus TaxID=154827 RepID=UPI002242B591|nr:zinc finger protein 445-like [Xyrauchen texanus]
MEQNRPVESSQLAEVLQSLATLHQSHQQSLLELRQDQDRRFFEIMRAQAEDRHAIRSLLSQEAAPAAAATPDTRATLPPPALQKMGPADDTEAFIDLFERTAEIWGWPQDQWAARLVPLLSGEAQLAAQQLPASSLLAYPDLRKAILQRVGRSPEESRQLFRALKLDKSDRPFAFAQRLRDACRRWLLSRDRGVEELIDQVVLEQFVQRLPRKTAEWVQCHRPASLEEAVRLAEDHMAAIPRADEPSLSVSPSPVSSPVFFPPLFPLALLSPQGPFLPPAGAERLRAQLPGLGNTRQALPHPSAALLLRWGHPPARVRPQRLGRSAGGAETRTTSGISAR